MAGKHEWRRGSRFDVDAEVAHRQMERVRRAQGGLLRPGDLVMAAADPGSLLHSEFEWDDSVAGSEFRLAQARRMIGAIVEVRAELPDQVPVRAYINVTVEERGYRTRKAVLEKPEWRDEAIRNIASKLAYWARQHREIKELARILDEATEQALALVGA